ncbi:MAG TPA: TolC family protein [Thermoanaerobaculia bacterium]|nr:TolC family protein [Thermoanaerobaculia bacterium]
MKSTPETLLRKRRRPGPACFPLVRLLLFILITIAGSSTRAQQSSPPAQPQPESSPSTQSPALPPFSAVTPPPSQVGSPVAPTAASASPPLSLLSATTTALQQASALQQAQLDEAIAEGDLRQAQAAILPRLRSLSTYAYNSPAHPPANPGNPSFIAQNAVREFQELLGVTGELSFGVTATVRRSRALLQAAHAGTEVARRALVRGVNQAYYGAALASAKRRAADLSLDAAREFERVTDLNYRAGEVPEVDVIRARLQTAARLDDALQAREAEVITNASLATLLGYDMTTTPNIEPLPQSIDRSDVISISPEGVSRRPELIQLEAQSRAARADIAVARADRLPRLTYSIDEGFDSGTLASAELRQHRGILATANLDIPLWDWGIGRSRQHQAALRARGAELQLQLGRRDLYLQYATARQEATTAAERVGNARRALNDAEKNVTISIARYRAGEAPILEATDAQTTVAAQRLALQQALYDFQIAQARLREAAGL